MFRICSQVASIVLLFSATANGDFIVRDVHSLARFSGFDGVNFAHVDDLLAGVDLQSEATAASRTLNMFDGDRDTGEGFGLFTPSDRFPNDEVGTDDNNFAIHARGEIVIPAAGEYTFGVNSDDGARIRMEIDGHLRTIHEDDAVHPPRSFLIPVTFDSAGTYPVDVFYFERTGQATFEFFATPGSVFLFDPDDFRLVGDVENGGLQVIIPAEVCGDFDLDGDVDSLDRTLLTGSWTGAMQVGEGDLVFANGDCDGDGDVDSADSGRLVQNWSGAFSRPQLDGGHHAAVVPEPTTATLGLVSVLILGARFLRPSGVRVRSRTCV